MCVCAAVAPNYTLVSSFYANGMQVAPVAVNSTGFAMAVVAVDPVNKLVCHCVGCGAVCPCVLLYGSGLAMCVSF